MARPTMNQLSESGSRLLRYNMPKEVTHMKYLKVFTDFQQIMEPLSLEERGRLFGAMLAYAEDGTAPRLTGNERFLWALARQNIDREAASYEQKVKHLRRGPVTK